MPPCTPLGVCVLIFFFLSILTFIAHKVPVTGVSVPFFLLSAGEGLIRNKLLLRRLPALVLLLLLGLLINAAILCT